MTDQRDTKCIQGDKALVVELLKSKGFEPNDFVLVERPHQGKFEVSGPAEAIKRLVEEGLAADCPPLHS